MSKRAGTFVTLRDVVEQVGPDVTRFVMLTRKNDAPLDFDFDKVLEQSKDNPVFYVQYAHARAHSVLARAARGGLRRPTTARSPRPTSAALGAPGELALARKAAEWPRQVEIAAASHEPHRIAFYLYDLAVGVPRAAAPGQARARAPLHPRGRARADPRRGWRWCARRRLSSQRGLGILA